MHPAIREFPSLNFYGGGLKDGPGVLQDTQRPWHSSPAFQPLVLIDVKGTVRGGAAAGREAHLLNSSRCRAWTAGGTLKAALVTSACVLSRCLAGECA